MVNHSTIRLLLPLLLSAASMTLIATAACLASDSNNEARAILDRHVAATGGEAAILEAKEMHYQGSIAVQGIEGTFDLYRGDGKILLVIDLPGVGKIQQGYDGTTGWQMGQGSPGLLKGADLEQLQYQANPAAQLRRSEDYKSIEFLGEVEFEGKTLNAVALESLGGRMSTEYFKPDSGLRYATVSSQDTPAGRQEVTVLYTENREFGRLTLPTHLVQKGLGPELVRNVLDVTYGPIDDSIFALPDPIAELLTEGAP